MAFPSVVLILGAGPRVGAAVATKFASIGYQVAVASRSGSDAKTDAGYFSLKADFSKPESILALLDKVNAEFHTAPSVVVYNAAALTPPPTKDSVLSIPAENFALDLNINTISPYVAAQQAIKGWETLPKETKKTFIYTGNHLNVNVVPVPMFMDLGVGKAASAFWIGTADANYAAQGYRFFYADERAVDGKNKGTALDGPAHAEFYAQLADHVDNVPWLATFVKDKGYLHFK